MLDSGQVGNATYSTQADAWAVGGAMSAAHGSPCCFQQG